MEVCQPTINPDIWYDFDLCQFDEIDMGGAEISANAFKLARFKGLGHYQYRYHQVNMAADILLLSRELHKLGTMPNNRWKGALTCQSSLLLRKTWIWREEKLTNRNAIDRKMNLFGISVTFPHNRCLLFFIRNQIAMAVDQMIISGRRSPKWKDPHIHEVKSIRMATKKVGNLRIVRNSRFRNFLEIVSIISLARLSLEKVNSRLCLLVPLCRCCSVAVEYPFEREKIKIKRNKNTHQKWTVNPFVFGASTFFSRYRFQVEAVSPQHIDLRERQRRES